jgi:hypothetical protein
VTNRPEYPHYPGQDDQGQPDPTSGPGGQAPHPPPPPSPPPPPYGQVPAGEATPAPHVPPPGSQRRTHPKATWALILGILGVVICCLFAGIPAIVLGHQAKGEVDAAPEEYEGRGMATAGFVLGIISTVGSAIYIAFTIVLIATDGFGEGL